MKKKLKILLLVGMIYLSTCSGRNNLTNQTLNPGNGSKIQADYYVSSIQEVKAIISNIQPGDVIALPDATITTDIGVDL